MKKILISLLVLFSVYAYSQDTVNVRSGILRSRTKPLKLSSGIDSVEISSRAYFTKKIHGDSLITIGSDTLATKAYTRTVIGMGFDPATAMHLEDNLTVDSLSYFRGATYLGNPSVDDGYLYFYNANNSYWYAITPGIPTANRTFILPNKSGIFAMTSDINQVYVDTVGLKYSDSAGVLKSIDVYRTGQLQNALNAFNGMRGEVNLLGDISGSGYIIPSNITLDGCGVGKITRESSSITDVLETKTYSRTGSITSGSKDLTISDTTDLDVGAIIMVRGAGAYPNTNQYSILTADMNGTQDSIVVGSTSYWDATAVSGRIGTEFITLGTTRASTVFRGCTRGVWGTSGATHSTGDTLWFEHSLMTVIDSIINGSTLYLHDTASTTVSGVPVTVGSINITIKNLYINGNKPDTNQATSGLGIDFDFTRHFSAEKNYVCNTEHTGILIRAGRDGYIVGNTIVNAGHYSDGITYAGAGIAVFENTYRIKMIGNNVKGSSDGLVISDDRTQTSSPPDGAGVGNVATGNTIDSCYVGIGVEGGQYCTISDNTFYNIGNVGIVFGSEQGIQSVSSLENKATNNTCNDCYIGIAIHPDDTTNVVYGNAGGTAFSNVTTSGTSSLYGLEVSPGITIKNNDTLNRHGLDILSYSGSAVNPSGYLIRATAGLTSTGGNAYKVSDILIKAGGGDTLFQVANNGVGRLHVGLSVDSITSWSPGSAGVKPQTGFTLTGAGTGKVYATYNDGSVHNLDSVSGYTGTQMADSLNGKSLLNINPLTVSDSMKLTNTTYPRRHGLKIALNSGNATNPTGYGLWIGDGLTSGDGNADNISNILITAGGGDTTFRVGNGGNVFASGIYKQGSDSLATRPYARSLIGLGFDPATDLHLESDLIVDSSATIDTIDTRVLHADSIIVETNITANEFIGGGVGITGVLNVDSSRASAISDSTKQVPNTVSIDSIYSRAYGNLPIDGDTAYFCASNDTATVVVAGLKSTDVVVVGGMTLGSWNINDQPFLQTVGNGFFFVRRSPSGGTPDCPFSYTYVIK